MKISEKVILSGQNVKRFWLTMDGFHTPSVSVRGFAVGVGQWWVSRRMWDRALHHMGHDVCPYGYIVTDHGGFIYPDEGEVGVSGMGADGVLLSA